jgi:fumarate hydratase class II
VRRTQRSLRHFSIGQDLIPREMIPAYAILKRSAAAANRAGGLLDNQVRDLITRACDEIRAGQQAMMHFTDLIARLHRTLPFENHNFLITHNS